MRAACVKRLGYDLQCEWSRAPWLHDLIAMTGRSDYFYEALLAQLRSFTEDCDSYDIRQVYELLCLLAADDPRRDRTALLVFLASQTILSPAVARECRWRDVAPPLIRLEGVDGFAICVERFEAELREDFADWGGRELRDWIEALEERDGVDATAAALTALRSSKPPVDELLKLDEARAPDKPKVPKPVDYASLKALNKPFPLHWIKNAPEKEILQAADDFLVAKDPEVIKAYLRIFTRRTYPHAPAGLFAFLDSDDPRIARSAAVALGRLKNASVRAAALTALDKGEIVRALHLLKANVESGDFARLDAAMTQIDDDEVWHDIGYALRDMIEDGHAAAGEARNLLIAAYEKGPCSICRTRIVEQLRDAGAAPDWMAQECTHDCDSRTRELFA